MAAMQNPMNNKTHALQIGSFECVVVNDGSGHLFPDAVKFLFANAPGDELEAALKQRNNADPAIPFRANCLYINTGQHRVLVDTGIGRGVHPDLGKLVDNLASIGVAPDDIDTLILTHAHADHIGGNTDKDGALMFPNAEHVMTRIEWEFWTSEDNLEKLARMAANVARAHLPPIKPKLRLIEPNDEIVPGIRAIPTPGHTPGHITIEVTDGGQRLVALIDMALDPIHIEHPEWTALPEMNPVQVAETRRRLFAQLAEGQTLVLAFHFEFPGLGHIVADGDGWNWHPLAEA